MVDYSLPLYQYPTEKWDAEKCKKAASYTASDGLGTKYSFKGYIGRDCYGATRFNGGITIDGVWYQGINRPVPEVVVGYKIVWKLSWGWQIKKCGK